MIFVRSIYCGNVKVYIELNFFIILKVYLMKYIFKCKYKELNFYRFIIVDI